MWSWGWELKKLVSNFQMKDDYYTAEKIKTGSKCCNMRTETTDKWLQRNSPFVLVTVGFIKQTFLFQEWKSCLLQWGAQSCTPCAAGCVSRSCLPTAGLCLPQNPGLELERGTALRRCAAVFLLCQNALPLQQTAVTSKGKVDFCFLHTWASPGSAATATSSTSSICISSSLHGWGGGVFT